MLQKHFKDASFQFRLEPIGASAAKEYSLEKSIEKMKSEWVNIHLSLVKYRDTVSKHQTNIYILLKRIPLIQNTSSEILERSCC